jgi:dihydroorotase
MEKYVTVTSTVRVSVNESKFTPQFLKEFRECFCNLQTIDEHIQRLAKLKVRGDCDQDFVEGYGSQKDMGIDIEILETGTEIED